MSQLLLFLDGLWIRLPSPSAPYFSPPCPLDEDQIGWSSRSWTLRALTSSYLSEGFLWLWPHRRSNLSRLRAGQWYNAREPFVGPTPKGNMPRLSKKIQPSGCPRPLPSTVASMYEALCQGPWPALSSHSWPKRPHHSHILHT